MESGALVRKSIGQEYSVNPDVLQYAKDNRISLPDKYTHRNLVNKPSFKTVQISSYAYRHFMSYESRPHSVPKYWDNWRNMTSIERLEAWLNIICIENRGKSFTYEILED